MTDIEVPTFQAADFKCPRCGHFSQQQWYQAHDTSEQAGMLRALSFLYTSRCLRCKARAIWLDGEMIYPAAESRAPAMSLYMPLSIKQDVDEARSVLALSPRASCALLRLATEKLCRDIVGSNQKFNKAIDQLVAQGISTQIQLALDVIRVTGNSAVHPGQFVDEDTESQAIFMFELLNLIVDERIGLKSRLKIALESMTEGERANIESRGDKMNGSAKNA